MDDTPSSNLHQQAIAAAIECRWQDALKLNKQIAKVDPENVDALNRQAKAYLELNKLNLAKKYYTLALKFDPYNPIALKNIKIIKAMKGGGIQKNLNGVHPISPLLFLQEPGKTKVVNLLKVAEPQKLSTVFPGMPVELVFKNRRIHILDQQGSYLGILPDDLSFQILRLTKGGNKYEVFIKSVRVNSLAVLLREVYRSKKFKNQPSFLDATHPSTSYSEIIAMDPTDTDDDDPEESEEAEA